MLQSLLKMVSYTGVGLYLFVLFLFSLLYAFIMGFHVVEFVLLYHSIVGILVERDKIINLKLLQRNFTKAVMSIMVDKMIKYSKDKRSLS